MQPDPVPRAAQRQDQQALAAADRRRYTPAMDIWHALWSAIITMAASAAEIGRAIADLAVHILLSVAGTS